MVYLSTCLRGALSFLAQQCYWIWFKGLKMVRNLKTWWMGILPCVPCARKPLILKMSEDAPTMSATKKILFGLFNTESLLSLPLLMPMLRSIDYLLKFSQSHDVYIIDYVAAIKLWQGLLHVFFCWPHHFPLEFPGFPWHCFECIWGGFVHCSERLI